MINVKEILENNDIVATNDELPTITCFKSELEEAIKEICEHLLLEAINEAEHYCIQNEAF